MNLVVGMELKEFLEQQIREHPDEIREILALQELLDLLHPDDRIFSLSISASSNG